MKKIINYYRVQRLANLVNIKIGFVSLQVMIFIFIINGQIVGGNGTFMDTVTVFVMSLIFMSFHYTRMTSEINHATLYPMKKSEKLINYFLYIIFAMVVLTILLVLIGLLLLLIFYIFDPSSITTEESDVITLKSFYYYSWVLSYGGFLHLLIHVRRRGRLWLVYSLGTLGYVLLNVLILSVLNNKFTLTGSIGDLFSLSSNHTLLHYILSGALAVSFVGAIIWSILLVKPRKKINYR